MTPHTPPRLAAALVRLIARRNDALVGDLEEQFLAGRGSRWYWSQLAAIAMNRCVHSRRLHVALVLVLAGLSTSLWSAGRFAVPILLGYAFTSWRLWRLHRSSLVVLYVTSVALLLPHWMLSEAAMMSNGDRLFWAIARILAGYGVVGILLLPFLILRLGRSGPLAEPPISLSLGR